MSTLQVITMTEAHWPEVRDIYGQGLATRNATFATSVPSWQEWDAQHLTVCRLAGVRSYNLVGWVALSAVSGRDVYRGVAEVSVYIAEKARGQGIGTVLLNALIEDSERNGFWTLQAGIFAENTASVQLHQKAGFRMVGIRERIGWLDGRWRDTVLMERRSKVVGV